MSDAPTVFAHRGFAGLYPENTVLAAEKAVEAGADAIEFDVMPTADGDIVVFHDDRLDAGPNSRGVTDETGIVWEQSTDTVTGARVQDSDQTVPLLSEMLRAIPSTVTVNIELKNPGTHGVQPGTVFGPTERIPTLDQWLSFVDRVLDQTETVDNPVLFSSFSEGALKAVDDLASDDDLAVFLWDDIEESLRLVRRYAASAIHVPLSMLTARPPFGAENRTAEQSVEVIDPLQWARDAGLDVNVWTVQTWWGAKYAVDAGCDGFFTNYPDLDPV